MEVNNYLTNELRIPLHMPSLSLLGQTVWISCQTSRWTDFDVSKYIFRTYVEVQCWKAVHLQTLEIRVEQKGNRVKKERKMEEKRKMINVAALGIEPRTY